MPNIWETEIDQDTPDDLLELCALSADRTSDVNVQRKASEAKAELKRRDREYERTQWQERFEAEGEEWRERFNAESKERVKAQQFQEAQAEKQLKISSEHLRVTKIATIASGLAAFAATRQRQLRWSF